VKTRPGQSLSELYEALQSSPPEAWDDTMGTNVQSVYFTVTAFLPLLGEAAKKGQGRGSVVLTGSISGMHWDIGFDNLQYQVSKAYFTF
jgi:NAD(P)-dependent dehydrogenase (short-subunit alcohol dehydrogenase family)